MWALLFIFLTGGCYANQSIQLPESLSSNILTRWQKFKGFTGRNLEKFVKTELNTQTDSIDTVFYPFGGPDVTYPLLLFPKATQITLVGLESPGQPDFAVSFDPDIAFPQTESLLRRSFFITTQMSQQLPKQTGVIYPILLQLKLLGVNDVSLSQPDLPYPGIKISFEHNTLLKSVTYYQANLRDDTIHPQFLNDIKDHQTINGCLLKSSSYIPHQKNFTKIREFITENARLIIQDDSGIPLRNLKNTFEIKLFGRYLGPYGSEFKGYDQPDLTKLVNEDAKSLPFCFGYGCGKNPSSLLLAIKKL